MQVWSATPNPHKYVYLDFHYKKRKMIERILKKEARETADDFKVVCVTGPRQSGKTTLCRQVFKDKPYISLEDPDVAAKAQTNERDFLSQFKGGAILDEIQRVPTLFNYLQRVVDEKKKNNQFILTGSSNFLINEKISQSLAGRTGYIELLTFSISELKQSKIKSRSIEETLLQGFYPAVVTGTSSSKRWLDNYIKTYVERDARMIKNIGNIILFSKFLKLCAGRATQLLNVNNLAVEVGVDNKTISSWLGVLESSYIIFLLPPYYKNFNKRIIKAPKLYFYDTGVLCNLLNVHSVSALKRSEHYGALFENLMITEIKKNRLNKEKSGQMYFFRDSAGNEVDMIIENEEGLLPVEIKASKKADRHDLRGLKWFQKVFRQHRGILLHGGKTETSHENEIQQLGWERVADI